MQGDPSGSVAEAPVSDTTTAPSDALATSEPTSDGASVVEGAGEGSDNPSEPTPDDESAEDGDDTPEGDEPSDQTEEQKRLSRKERQRLREAERLEKERQDAVEAYKQSEAERVKREEESRKAQEAVAERNQRLARHIGKPTGPDDPGEVVKVQQEIEALHARSRAELLNPTADFDPEAHDRAIETKRARLTELGEREAMAGDIEDFVWSHFSGGMASALGWPELSDPTVKSEYWNHPDGIPGSLQVLKAAILAANDAKHADEITRIKSEHTTAMKALEADRNGWRARAGGEEVADTTSGGTPASSGEMSLDQFKRLPLDQRKRMRMEQPELVNAMYARSVRAV